MNNVFRYVLKVLRKLNFKVFKIQGPNKPICESNPEKVSQIIDAQLTSDKPCMIARFGAFELATMVNYLGVKKQKKNVWKFITGKQEQWWWNKKLLEHMQNNAGFFPPTEEKMSQFCELMIEDLKEIDVLGSWLAEEHYFLEKIKGNRVRLLLLEPFWTEISWMKALENKKVLVVHPFKHTILSQYKKRELLFQNKTILPSFKTLHVIKAVQSIGGDSDYNDWFEALEWMKDEIDKYDYDICLIGAGAYGFPLAAHVKRKGKKSVHLGGSLQLLFGIKGKRWENESFGEQTFGKKNTYKNLMNQFWVYPSLDEKPNQAKQVEDACYW